MKEQNEQKPFDYRTESKEFAYRVINVYQYLNERAKRKEKVLSKQLLITGTAIGEKIRVQDHLAALNAAISTKYWLELLVNGSYLTEGQSTPLLDDCIRLLRYLYAIVHKDERKERKEAKDETL